MNAINHALSLNGAEFAISCGVAVTKEFTLSEGAVLFLHRRKALRFSDLRLNIIYSFIRELLCLKLEQKKLH